jgi:hypothetical protein
MEYYGCHKGCSVAWESTTYTLIHTKCLSKCGFCIKDAAHIVEEGQDNRDWVELHGKMDSPSR